MAIEAILCEIDLLHGVGARLVQLADDHLPLSQGLRGIAESIRNTATLRNYRGFSEPREKLAKPS
jgi:hypothetical protein